MAQAWLALCPLPGALAPQGLTREGQSGREPDSCRGMVAPWSSSSCLLLPVFFSGKLEGRGSSMLPHSLSLSFILCCLLQATATLYRYLSSPPASAPTGDSLMAHESLAFALHDQQQQPPTATTPTTQPPG